MLVKNYIYIGSLVLFLIGFLVISSNIERFKEYNQLDHFTATKMILSKWEVESHCVSTECRYVGELSLQFKLYNKDFDCKAIVLESPISKNRTEIEEYMQARYIFGGEFAGHYDRNTLEELLITCYLYNPQPEFPTTVLIVGTTMMCLATLTALLTAIIICVSKIFAKISLVEDSSPSN